MKSHLDGFISKLAAEMRYQILTGDREMTLTQPDYCYSADEELFQYESFGDLLDYLDGETEDKIGATYWRGEKKELTHAECIDVDSFLEICDDLHSNHGDSYSG